MARKTDSLCGDGYAVRLENGRIHVELVKRWLDDAIRVETESTIFERAGVERSNAAPRWRQLTVAYDGSAPRRASPFIWTACRRR